MRVERLPLSSFQGGRRVFQTGFWAEVKRTNAWEPYFFRVEDGGERACLLVLVRTFARGAALAYVPMGPPLELARREGFLADLAAGLRPLLPRAVFALRLDLPFDYENIMALEGLSEEEAGRFYASFAAREGLRPARTTVQPQGTVANLLASPPAYHKRARRILRRCGGQVSVSLWDGEEADLEAWHRIYLETARRDGFGARSLPYIRRALELDGTGGVRCRLLLARAGGAVRGGIVLVSNSDEMVYLLGASGRGEPNVSYPLQDAALALAREEGIGIYDFYGTEGTQGRGEALRSLSLFKLAFGGKALKRIPTMDKVYKRLPWRLFTILEAARRLIPRRRPGA